MFVTTHYLDEAEYCHNMMLMHAGKLIAGGSPQKLKTETIQHPMLEVACDRVIEAMDLLQREQWVLETSVFGTYLHVNVEDEEEGKQRIRRLLSDHHIMVKRMDRIVPSLEDVFIHWIEKKRET